MVIMILITERIQPIIDAASHTLNMEQCTFIF